MKAVVMTQSNENVICPHCGELVKENWKCCPACEMPLTSFVCPQCKTPVKEHWKRCPECEAPLLCRSCGRRIPMNRTGCPTCKPESLESSKQVHMFTEPITGMVFLYVSGGTFMMGGAFGDGIENEQPVHEVQLDGFYMSEYLVTQAQWKCVLLENPSKFHGELRPVEQVSWHDVQRFIRKLTEANNGRYQFLLPTEAQWEYAARSGGREERYAGGDHVGAVAWYVENSGGMTQPVGTKGPNGLGLYDMSGNVWEWCQDTFRADAYEHHESKNPICTEDGPDRVIRGGSWNLDAWSVRCARRFSLQADFYGAGLGFRLVMIP